MRHRRRSSVLPTRVHRSVVGLAAVGLLASGTLSAPGAIEGAELATEDAGTLTWFVEDEAGSAVHSTTYQLTGPDGFSLAVGDNLRDDTNTTHGTVTVDGLAAGAYTITPDGGPEGVELGDAQTAVVGEESGTPITFVVAPVVQGEVPADEAPVEEAEEPAPVEEAEEPAPVEEPTPAEETEEPAPAQAADPDLDAWYGDGQPEPGQEVDLQQAEFPARMAPLATPRFAPNADVPIGTVRARMRDQQPTSGNCITYAPTGGSSGQSAWVTNTGEAQTGHGSPSQWGCPGSLNTSTQSVLGFNPVATSQVATGTPFLLGRMTHYNNPVYASAQYFDGKLDVQFAGVTLTFPWRMNETPNTGGDVDDVTTFTGQIGEQVIDVDGIPHKLVVLGFTQSGTQACPATPDGAYVNEFITKERAQTHGCLYAQLTQVRTLQIAKVVDNAGGTVIPNFPFTTTSTLSGSPWNSAFGLRPTGEGEDNAATTNAREVLAGAESVTIAESLPTGWFLTTAACVDGLGNEVASSLSGTTLSLADIPAASSASELPIVCTVHNARTYENPTITKTATPAYQVEHIWDIEKDVDETRVTYPEGADVPDLTYTVEVTPMERKESAWTVTGEITVTNPNAVDIQATLSDAVDNGGTCQVGAGTVVVAPGVNTYPYTCTYDSAPTTPTGQNTATLQWDAGAYPGTDGQATTTVPFDFGSIDPSPNTHETITVVDDLAEGSPWTITWPEDGSTVTELTYSVPATGTPGACTTIDNTATISETGQSDATETEVCVGSDLTVSKNVVVSLDRSYSYEIEKSVDAERKNVDPETGEAEFTYTVTVTDGPSADSNWVMTGEITVANPNDWPVVTDVTDEVDNGGVCTVAGGEGVTIPANTPDFVLSYSCTFEDQPDYDGTNTATATWDQEEYFSPSGSATGQETFEVADWGVTPINQTVTVMDDQTDPENPEEIGTHTWTGEGESEEFSYPLALEGVEGDCAPYTNTTWLEELPGVSDDQEVTVCWPLDVEVTKTVDADFDREYFWELAKEADETQVTITDGGTAEFNYVVTATPAGSQDSGFAMGGEITVSNPNATGVTVDLIDTVADLGTDVSCEVAPEQLTVPAEGEATAAYTCEITGAPNYTGGTNTATATWTVDGETRTASSGPVGIEFALDGETNREVQVWDDMVFTEAPGELLGTAIWNAEGTPTAFPYSNSFDGVSGECTTYTNTAVIPMTGDDAEETVTVCVEAGPTVSKTVDAQFDREYLWTIEKEADRTEVTLSEAGTAEFNYVVSATPAGSEDSGWEMSGQITVTNQNEFQEMAVTVTDVADVGGECTVADGEDVVLAGGETGVFDYTCSFDEQPEYAGTNVAEVTWTDLAGEEQTSSSDPVDVEFELAGETNAQVEVFDDKVTGEAPGESLGTATWNAEGTPTEFEYHLDLAGESGTCLDYTNTAVIPAADQEADETVTVCVEAAPEVAKTAAASYDRTYDWDIAKDVDETSVEIIDTTATFHYVVTTSPAGFEDSNWALTGQISVTNPNDFQEMTVSVTDVVDVGGVCTVVDGEDVVVAAGETVTLDYSCSFDEQPVYAGTNTASVAWTDHTGADQIATAEADVAFELDGETNLEVEVHDDKVTGEAPGELLGTSHYYDGPFEFTYDLPMEGTPGECVTHTNTAVIPATGDEDDQDVTICVEDELVITKTVETDFDRQFLWDLAKEADETELTIGEDGTATFDYTVTATPDPEYVDSNWAMSGQISVTNPNTYDEGTVTVEITDESTVGGTCAVIDGEDVVVAPGATVVFDYTCTFTEQPAYEGTNTATVTWSGPEDEERSVITEIPVAFEDPVETNRTVEVYDDKVTGIAPGEYLFTAEWNAEGTPIEFEYSLDLPGEAGTCVDHTNTAVILMTDEEAQETVTVCSTLAPEVSKDVAASFDRLYNWDLVKAADTPTNVTIGEGQEATFAYTVEAIPVDFTDSAWVMGGQVSVTNPNTFEGGELTVTVTDLPGVGGECTVADAEDVVLAPAETQVFDYTCSFEEQPEYAGTNVAEVAWTGPGETSGTATAEADVDFVLDGETNRSVEVYDDKVTGEAPGELLGTAHFYDGPFEFTYPLGFPGVPGECTDYTNVATIPAADAEDDETVTVCVELAPEVDKTAEASYDREYFWDIEKIVDATTVEVIDTTATFHYVVAAIADGFEDSGWELTGQISVTNPNGFQEMTVSVTDVVDVGGVCTVVDGEDVVVAAGETVTLDYSCSFDEEPEYAGTNTASVAWTDHTGADQTATTVVDVAFGIDEETNRVVDVYDNQVFQDGDGELLGTADWLDGRTEFTYDLDLEGTPGECVTYTNTAVIEQTVDEDDADATICVEDELVITKTAETDFDREYLWDLAKEADETQLTIGEDGTATFDYTVTATPDPDYVDSNWTMSGQISVTNPNTYDEGTVTVEITDESTVGGTCEVVDGEDVVVAPGATVVFDYTCTFTEQPEYEGTNTATVTWTGPEDEERSVTTEIPVSFEDPVETNRTVEVYDDMVTGEAPGELLGEAVWNAEGTPIEFEYSLELPGEAGTCVDHTNTAIIPATGDEDEETVTVCSTLAPEVSKTVEAGFDREYDWTIAKEVDRTRVVLTEDGTAEFNYVVSAIPGDFTDSAWTMGGQVSVTNPNTFEGGELTVTVTDLPGVGGECTVVDGQDVVLAPAETRAFDYTCSFEEQPEYAGTNVAEVAWTGPGETSGTATAEADVDFVLDGETNRSVEVYDDKVTGEAPGELLGEAEWNAEGTPIEFEYSLDLPGEVGSCVDHTNTAVIQGAGSGDAGPDAEVLAVGDQAEVDVTVCIEAAPEVAKTADASFDRAYDWALDKVADATEVEITEDGTAIFNYLVTATPGGFVDSGWEMTGEITVTNPNDFQEMAMTVTDVATVGGSCVVAEGEDVVLAAGETRVLPYECTFGTQPDYEGSNTAYVSWTDADGAEQTTTSAPVEVAFELDEETNREVEVYDDKVTGEAPGELLGTAEWNAEGTPTEFTYDLELEGVVGECVDYTNTAVIPATEDEAEATVTVCVQDDLVITKTAEASYDRAYDWALAKEADQTSVTIAPDGTATFDYAVSATPDGFTDSGWEMDGQISVTNPNAYDEGMVTIEVTDDASVGSCEVVDGVEVELAPGETRVFDYTCSFDEQPEYEGTNTATVTWTGPDGSERVVSTEVPVTFEVDQESNATVEVFDDLVTGEAPGELLGTAEWNAEGTPTVFEYSLELPGEAGTCVDHTNTAVIPATGDDVEETVTVCVEIGPEVSKTAEASYDRSYDWALAKEADRTLVELTEPGTAEFTYVVTATPDGYTDSGWEMSGQVTVTNPNDFQEMAVTVTDQATVGGSCVVADGEDIVLAAGETRVLTYECSFTEQPEYEGSNTAVVTWTNLEGAEQATSSEAVEVSFEVDEESNLVVEVYDDMVTGKAPGELLGTADWRDGPTEFTYGLAMEGVVGECVDYTNTAVIPATDDEAQETVRVCVDAGEDPQPPTLVDPKPPAPIDPKPPAPIKPIIPTGDPVSSGPQAALVVTGLTAMILALLGAAFFWRRRQD